MINTIDKNVYSALFEMIKPMNTHIMIGVSFFGSASVLISITVILLILLKNKRIPKYIAINLVLVFILNRIIKAIIRRPRPQALALVIEKGFSFPSAHAMVSFGFYGFIIYLIMKSKINKKQKMLYSSILFVLVLLIGISRIYLGVHYATDVIGGFIIGLIYLLIFIKYVYKRK